MIRYGTPENIKNAEHQVLCEVDRQRGFGRIILNRPEKRNAMSVPMRDRMVDLIHTLEADDAVRVIIFQGNGPSFSSGAELNEDWGQRGKTRRFTLTHAYLYASQMTWGRAGIGQAVNRSSKVTIAQVQGFCAAAAYFFIASRCDLVAMSDDARIGALEARFLGPATATTSIHLNRILGTKATRLLGYTGMAIDAEAARRYGIAHSVVPLSDLSSHVEALATSIAARPAELLLYLKGRIRAGESHLGTNVPVVSGLLASHFIRRAADEHDFFDSVRKGGVKAALAEDQRRAAAGTRESHASHGTEEGAE
jgi:enoyl-CoA hydratase/carnithine racemase